MDRAGGRCEMTDIPAGRKPDGQETVAQAGGVCVELAGAKQIIVVSSLVSRPFRVISSTCYLSSGCFEVAHCVT